MAQSATPVYPFSGSAPLPLAASFDGGRLTSDGGLPWLEQAEMALGLCAAFAAVIPEWRRGPVRHALETLVRQRVFQIACGYEDQDDADTLRTDPLLKLVCGQLPESGRDLASQPTLSRLENAVDRRACYRLAVALGELLSAGARAGRASRPTSSWTWTAPTTRPTGPGRQRLPRLLPAAHVSPAAGLRWRDPPAHHGGAASRQHPRQHGGGGGAQARRAGGARALAGGDDRGADGQRRGRAGHLRLVRAGRDRLHHRARSPIPA